MGLGAVLLIGATLLGLSAGAGVLGWVGVSRARWLAYHRFKGEPIGPAPGLGELAAEIGAMLRVGWWHVRALGRDALIVPVGSSGPPVVCVHGYTQNGTNFWGIRQALHARGRPTIAVSLGLPPRRIERYADRLRQVLGALGERYERVDVVAHSMGGVVLRHVLATEPALVGRIDRIVTLGSPHRGTAASRGLPGRLLPEIVQIKRRSAWLRELPALGELAPDCRVVTVAGRNDLVVYPPETCHDAASVRIELDGVGHAGLLARPDVISLVADALAGPRSPT